MTALECNYVIGHLFARRLCRDLHMKSKMAEHFSAVQLQRCIEEGAAAIGIRQLKPEQKEAITAFANGRDVFVSLPTGYGKSVCYGCLPGLFARLRGESDCTESIHEPIVVVVSPLVSIMKDQTRDFSMHYWLYEGSGGREGHTRSFQTCVHQS